MARVSEVGSLLYNSRIRSLGYNQADTASTSSQHSQRLVHSPILPPSPSSSRAINKIASHVSNSMINTLGCLIIVSAIKLNLDAGVLMTSINDVLQNLPIERVKDIIGSFDFDATGGSSGASLTSIIQEAASTSSIPLDQTTSTVTDPDVPTDSKVLKLVIGAGLLIVAMAAAAKGLR